MANVALEYDRILNAEGGLTSDGLTNMGITIATYNMLAGTLGVTNSFYKLTENDVELFIDYFWNEIRGDEIQNQAIAATLLDWYWNSGNNAIESVAAVLNNIYGYNLTDRAAPPSDGFINDLNGVSDQKDLLNNITQARKDYYTSLAANNPGKFAQDLKGWLNRVQNLYNEVVAYTKANKAAVVIFSFATLTLIGIGLYHGRHKKMERRK